MTDNSRELGRVTCSLKGTVAAGTCQTCVLCYTAGFAGVDDTGSLKIVMRYATDSGLPQFDDPSAPHYTTAVASNGARLQLRYDVKDFRRPWGRTIHVKVLQGYLRKGETITLTIGDTSSGSPGWKMQTFLEDTFELKVLVDRYATYVYEELPKSPTFRIGPGIPTKLVAIAPTTARPDNKIQVRVKREDAWGNPVGTPWKVPRPVSVTDGPFRLSINDDETGLSAVTNPCIISAKQQPGRFWADIHGQSEETVGTNTIDSYFRFARDRAFVDVSGHQGNDFQITDDFWQTINDTTARFNKDGRFIVFPGWEWSGNTGLGGDRNVFFKNEGGIISRSSRALVEETKSTTPCSSTVEELFDRIANCGHESMLVPHVGGRFADLERHREGLEPVVEVHSAWGTFEWMLDDAFSRGYRIGIVANSDGHKGRPGASYPGASTFGSYGGLTCILADKLDRDHIWEAYQSRRVYATTGARIFLDVATDNGDPIGSVLTVNEDNIPTFQINVSATAPIERIEIRNAMKVLKTVRTYGKEDLSNRVKLLWQGAEVRGRGRQVTWDGELTVTGNSIRDFETINFWNQEKRCEQLSKRQLKWQSITTGGVAGLILDLAKPTAGSIDLSTTQKSLKAKIVDLNIKGRTRAAGGLGKAISAYRLPPANGPLDCSIEFTPSPKQLSKGDNPFYICVVQEDGHMAWSSPIYLVRN
ncbi:MAG: DUF3604 domain-containing protein [Planctomycetales bacterium]|jgi:hypothetical protein